MIQATRTSSAQRDAGGQYRGRREAAAPEVNSSATGRGVPRMALSVKELAQTLGISRPKAYELAHTSGFPAVKIGGRIVVNAASLQRWLDENEGAFIDI